MSREFEHPPLGDEIEAISGRYSLSKESSLMVGGREVLYLVGAGAFDSSCCGEGGCAYALVPGFLVKRAFGKSGGGRPVSLVEPITDPGDRREIEAALKQSEQVQQVNFL